MVGGQRKARDAACIQPAGRSQEVDEWSADKLTMTTAFQNGTDISVCRIRQTTPGIKTDRTTPLYCTGRYARARRTASSTAVEEPWVVRGRGSAGTASSGGPPSDTGTSTTRESPIRLKSKAASTSHPGCRFPRRTRDNLWIGNSLRTLTASIKSGQTEEDAEAGCVQG